MESEPGGELYVYKNNQRLRCGHTTGSCATAAAKAAVTIMLSKKSLSEVSITTPNGTVLNLPVLDVKISENSVSCAVRKDGGDDIDATHGALVYAEVSFIGSGINIDGGKGVGKVTKKGLDQPVGNAAINSVPRQTIFQAVKEVCTLYNYSGGVDVIISVPEGEQIAEKTFNPRLGIMGGISIIGTTGIVEPMSQEALVETIRTEMKMRLANGSAVILAVPGNYGEDFSQTVCSVPAEQMVKCSNFIGETIDSAVEFGAQGLLFISNIGKFVKVAGGIMNTHSRNADCRLEILTAHAALAGADNKILLRIMDSVMTEDALDVLSENNLLQPVMKSITDKINFYLDNRAKGQVITGAIIFSSNHGMLGKTENADKLLKILEDAP
ncbi:cobalt-precorrin-6A synthase [Candidatus Methanomassiliicoccus intestinalis]|uniref:Cobalt-precorrin-5B C(1)-methyltransferase n=1 Tax=Methanomassiliicoccus intestinalis (strain Issoire-Mx1) TaxID=1295009 RepID=R9T8A6_METII|nr:cobalt-precorrin-5B (C(1))-methyltransferase CbiD [Candidatus Methanomassiliicoccus intestinalis]AGN25583.1 cobalamin biosynthesis protein CbiD [Candidatus Methanomassiliicoccus intestinalis Issoire-Mx1]TQS80698.1 MAG: cobalt-precorrin-6A synthase [Candidatus Methanomassiliicoccus intestinalis]